MCAIVDANVAGEVFGEGVSPAGREFFNWLNGGRGRLVVGGKLLQELEESQSFKTWASNATLAGRMTTLSANEVEARARQIENKSTHSSNDVHVVADGAQLRGNQEHGIPLAARKR